MRDRSRDYRTSTERTWRIDQRSLRHRDAQCKFFLESEHVRDDRGLRLLERVLIARTVGRANEEDRILIAERTLELFEFFVQMRESAIGPLLGRGHSSADATRARDVSGFRRLPGGPQITSASSTASSKPKRLIQKRASASATMGDTSTTGVLRRRSASQPRQ